MSHRTSLIALKGITSGNGANPVIMPPASGLVSNAFSSTTNSFWGFGTPFAAQILIEGGADVTLTGIAFDATGFNIATCSPVVVGVLVQDASATLNPSGREEPVQPMLGLGYSGIGVLTQNDASSATTFAAKNTTFVNAGQAFESDGASNTSTLTNNSFAGNPANNSNAISILSGNSTIQGNTISNFNYPLAGTNFNAAAYGIYLSCVPGSSVVNNHIATTQVGIYALNGCTTTAVSMTGNEISDAQFMAIYAGGTNGLVQGNDIRTSQTASPRRFNRQHDSEQHYQRYLRCLWIEPGRRRQYVPQQHRRQRNQSEPLEHDGALSLIPNVA
jgi:hypothetical protein